MTQIASQEDVDKILKAFYLVYNTLGYGFLERVYQNALYFELIEQGFKCEVQKQIKGQRIFLVGKLSFKRIA